MTSVLAEEWYGICSGIVFGIGFKITEDLHN